MLITFKSDADGDVIMFGEVGQSMLKALGKDPGEVRGIVTVAQLPQAIAGLQGAIEARKAEQSRVGEPDDFATDRDPSWPRPEPVVSFVQRAVPLLTMLEHAQRTAVPVLWVSSGAN